MGTFADIKQDVISRTGLSGSNYSAQIERAINRCIQHEICAVRWEFLYNPAEEITIANTFKQYKLPSDFMMIDEDNVYISTSSTATKYKLTRGSQKEYIASTLTTTGRPRRFRVFGTAASGTTYGYTSADAGKPGIAVYYPTPNGAYVLIFGYWVKVSDYTGTETTIISRNYLDAPQVSGACAIVAKELEMLAFAEDFKQEFIADMQLMQSKIPFTGPSYMDLLALRGKGK